MGLLSTLKRMKVDEKEIRILMLGHDNAGKTTILKKLASDDSNFMFTNIMPPTRSGFHIKSLVQDGFTVKVWDIGGSLTIRPYIDSQFDSTDALVYVVDSSDRRLLEESGQLLYELLAKDQLQGIPLLVFANKQDLVWAKTATQIADFLQLEQIRDRRWSIHPCSARGGDGLQDGLEWLVKQCGIKRKYEEQEASSTSMSCT
mmetsp:Transcript_9421/g.17085  ORF Transcript_9421/g.17085 Transcript_9421/m.17085 type:complete len:202 (+) Transcript_9421:68-673(+)